MTTGTATTDSGNNYDRAKEVKEFDDSKIGVKGLVDSGITTIPRIFIHSPAETLPLHPSLNPNNGDSPNPSEATIPVIDLSFSTSHRRSTVVEQIREASAKWGFFQIINHGVPTRTLESTLASIKAFNEQPTEVKSRFYGRETGTGVSFSTNFDLFKSKAASWRDTLQIKMGPVRPELDCFPDVCREELVEWDEEVKRLGEGLMEILCEGLGLKSERLKEMTCLENRLMVCHYYPYCPEPDRTVGIKSHADPGVLTVLLQDEVGGLQVKCGENWVDVKPMDGALVINIGDILQIISNDEYKSVEHRVLANPFPQPRISTAIFFNPSAREDIFGPLPELISPEKPAHFREFTLSEFMRRFFSKELDGKSMIDYFRV